MLFAGARAINEIQIHVRNGKTQHKNEGIKNINVRDDDSSFGFHP